MRFVIDETSWNFNDLAPERCVEALEEILDRIDDAQEQGFGCCYSDELFHLPIRDGRSFYDLYGNDSPITIPPEIRIRIAAAFSRLPFWQDLELPWPDSLEVTIGVGVPEIASSIAWAHKQSLRGAGNAVSCISHPIRRISGKIEVSVDHAVTSIWFVSSARDAEWFFRWLIGETTESPDELEMLSPFAFQGVDFVPGAFNGIKSMSKPYRDVMPTIIRHLAALSDHGARIFSGPRERISAEFGPLGVDISDENGATKRNRAAREERTIVVKGEPRVFWWHTKLERHQDRIHICPEKIKSHGRVLVGIFCRHLTT